MKNQKILHIIAFSLVAVGGINWGLFGLFGIDLVEVIFGTIPVLADFIYTLVGVATVYLIVVHIKECKVCATTK
jgi:uncharacterized membrane protein YuzA (DUF378 family)